MAGLQFLGKDAVLKAYNDRGIPVWGIFQKKDLNAVGDSDQELVQWLNSLAEYGASSTYTLKVYNGLEPDDITDKTPANGSFNFKLAESGMGSMSSPRMAGSMGTIEQRIASKISEDIKADIDEVIDNRINGVKDESNFMEKLVKGYMEEPEKLVGLIRQIKGIFTPSSYPPVAAVAGIPQHTQTRQHTQHGRTHHDSTPSENQTSPADIERLRVALDVLGANDPKIIDHLEKLAILSQDEPEIFRMAIRKIEAL